MTQVELFPKHYAAVAEAAPEKQIRVIVFEIGAVGGGYPRNVVSVAEADNLALAAEAACRGFPHVDVILSDGTIVSPDCLSVTETLEAVYLDIIREKHAEMEG